MNLSNEIIENPSLGTSLADGIKKIQLKITSKNQRKNKSDYDMVYLSVIKEFRDEQEELLKEEQELSNKNVKSNKNGK